MITNMLDDTDLTRDCGGVSKYATFAEIRCFINSVHAYLAL